MTTNSEMFLTIILSLGLGYGILRTIEFMFTELRRKGKARIIWWDQDARKVRIDYLEMKAGKVTTGKGEGARTVLLEADAMMAGQYPTWFVHPELGWNYRAPTRAETVDADMHLAVLAVSNPASYHKALARHEWADTMDSNHEDKDKWGWVFPVTIAGCIALVGLFGMVGWLVYTISQGGTAVSP